MLPQLVDDVVQGARAEHKAHVTFSSLVKNVSRDYADLDFGVNEEPADQVVACDRYRLPTDLLEQVFNGTRAHRANVTSGSRRNDLRGDENNVELCACQVETGLRTYFDGTQPVR